MISQHEVVKLIAPVIQRLEAEYDEDPAMELRLTIGLLSCVCASIYGGSAVLEEHAELSKVFIKSLKERLDSGQLGRDSDGGDNDSTH
jgi:hypothetical protein